jgi:hypothetical protein
VCCVLSSNSGLNTTCVWGPSPLPTYIDRVKPGGTVDLIIYKSAGVCRIAFVTIDVSTLSSFSWARDYGIIVPLEGQLRIVGGIRYMKLDIPPASEKTFRYSSRQCHTRLLRLSSSFSSREFKYNSRKRASSWVPRRRGRIALKTTAVISALEDYKNNGRSFRIVPL